MLRLRILTQVDGLMNNRPLNYHSEDLENETMTPNHMIYGNALPNNACDLYSADDNEDDCSIACSKRMRYLSTVINHWWKR